MAGALRVAIVGAGIGGLAAAIALLKRGIDVRIYEQAAALQEVGAGVAIQPNGMRMLRRLGLADAVARCGARWWDPQFCRADGSWVAPMWRPEMAREIEFYGIHRADLLARLIERLPAGIVRTAHRCVGFTQEQDRAELIFANGARATADVVVAADGIHSVLQRLVVAASAPQFSGAVAYRGLISAASVSWPAGAMRNWLGAGKHFLAYPVRAGELINYVGVVQTNAQMQESWSRPADPGDLAREFVGWDPMVEAIIARARATFLWGLYDREPLSRWTCGRLALLGDAAHPMLPHLGQGANQAIEDAVVLAAVLSRAERTSAPRALQMYELLRRERCAR